MTEIPSAALAGATAGSVALVVFLVVHAIWILPIWGMLGMLPVAALVGALAAWPFEHVSARGALPPPPLDGIAFAAMLLATLLPTAVYGVISGPVDQQHITWQSLVVPLALAAPAGALIGLVLAGSVGGAAALAVAAVALAFTIGHNLPFFPLGSPGWEKAFSLVVAVELAGGAAFSGARAAMALAPVAAR